MNRFFLGEGWNSLLVGQYVWLGKDSWRCQHWTAHHRMGKGNWTAGMEVGVDAYRRCSGHARFLHVTRFVRACRLRKNKKKRRRHSYSLAWSTQDLAAPVAKAVIKCLHDTRLHSVVRGVTCRPPPPRSSWFLRYFPRILFLITFVSLPLHQ